MSELYDIIKERRSVRSFNGKQLSRKDRDRLEEFIKGISNPFGIPVRFVLLDAETFNLSTPVIAGEKLYVAGKVDRVPYAEEAYGYSFERLVLYAWSLGIGTTWIGGTMKRSDFETAAELSEGEMMPCVSPLGYPAPKITIRESLMRKGVGADSRMETEKIFFEGDFEHPISDKLKEENRELTEMVRRAPSSVNKQPWRIIIGDGVFHIYEKKDKGFVSEATGDLQKIDVGIALCHLVMAIEDSGRAVSVEMKDPLISTPENVEYIATVSIK